MAAPDKSKVEAYCETWTNTLALLLSRLSSANWQPGPATAALEYLPVLRVRVSGGNELNGRQWVSFSQADAAELLRISRPRDPGAPADPTLEQNQALVEFVQQWAEIAARALEADLGKLALQVAVEESPPESTAHTTMLGVSDGAQSLAVRLEIDENLAKTLVRREPVVDPIPAGMAPARIEELVRQGNLGLLMDVELGVMLQFGCRQATLREVLDLTIGAVLELDREIQEPVELLLNRRVIARGEVVVIDGNYGLRVTEVAPARQRVDSL